MGIREGQWESNDNNHSNDMIMIRTNRLRAIRKILIIKKNNNVEKNTMFLLLYDY